jgi:ribosomal-protein-alanine N-acetyltransferase
MMKSGLKLTGVKFFLRPIMQEDISLVYVGWLNDPEVNQYLETKYHTQTLETVRAFVTAKMKSSDEFLFAICDRQTKTHLGNIKIGPVNPHHKTADISLFIGDKSMWGKGAASEAIYLASNFAFSELKLNKLKAGCYARNLGSAKAFGKCGYQKEGVLRKSIIFEGNAEDSFLFGVLPEELNKPA